MALSHAWPSLPTHGPLTRMAPPYHAWPSHTHGLPYLRMALPYLRMALSHAWPSHTHGPLTRMALSYALPFLTCISLANPALLGQPPPTSASLWPQPPQTVVPLNSAWFSSWCAATMTWVSRTLRRCAPVFARRSWLSCTQSKSTLICLLSMSACMRCVAVLSEKGVPVQHSV